MKIIRNILTLVGFLTGFAALAQVQNVTPGLYTPGFFSSTNYVKNSSCFSNTESVSATTSANRTRTTTTPLFGSASCALDASASGELFQWASKTPEPGTYNQNCEMRFTYNGDGTLYKFYALVNGVKVSPDTQLVSATGTAAINASTNFPCGSGTAILPTIESTSASAAPIKVGSMYAGLATNLSPQSVVTDWQAYTPTYTGLGTVTTNEAFWRRVGDSIYVRGRSALGTTTGVSALISFPAGLTVDSVKSTIQSTAEGSVTNNSAATIFIPVMVGGDAGFGIANAASSSLSKVLGTTVGSSGNAVGWEVGPIPISGWTGTGTSVRADQTDTVWASDTCTSSWTANTTTTCKWRRKGENMEIQFKNALTGAPTAATLTFTLPGSYTIDTAKLVETSQYRKSVGTASGYDSSATSVLTFIPAYSSSTSIAVLYNTSVTTAAMSFVNATAPMTWATGDAVEAVVSVPITGWSETQKAPVLVGSVTSNASGAERVERLAVTNSGVPAISTQSGTWVSSITDNAVGDMTINIVAGTFTAAPTCICTSYNATIARTCQADPTTPVSTTALRLLTTTGGGAANDHNINVVCVGPR